MVHDAIRQSSVAKWRVCAFAFGRCGRICPKDGNAYPVMAISGSISRSNEPAALLRIIRLIFSIFPATFPRTALCCSTPILMRDHRCKDLRAAHHRSISQIAHDAIQMVSPSKTLHTRRAEYHFARPHTTGVSQQLPRQLRPASLHGPG